MYLTLAAHIDKLEGNQLQYIYPTDYLLQICEGDTVMIAASNLKMESTKEEKKTNAPDAHFGCEFMNTSKWVTAVSAIKDNIKKRLRAALYSEECRNVLMSSIVATVSSKIMKNLRYLMNQEIRNEAELHFCIGDPILCGVCDAWKYHAKLEESVKAQTTSHSEMQTEEDTQDEDSEDTPEDFEEAQPIQSSPVLHHQPSSPVLHHHLSSPVLHQYTGCHRHQKEKT